MFQLRYEERIQDRETRNLKLQRDVDELTCSSRPHSSQLAVHRELDSVKERHRKHVLDLEQTIDGLRQQLLRLRTKEHGMYAYHLCQVNGVNGGDTVFIWCLSVCLCVCLCAADRSTRPG